MVRRGGSPHTCGNGLLEAETRYLVATHLLNNIGDLFSELFDYLIIGDTSILDRIMQQTCLENKKAACQVFAGAQAYSALLGLCTINHPGTHEKA